MYPEYDKSIRNCITFSHDDLMNFNEFLAADGDDSKLK